MERWVEKNLRYLVLAPTVLILLGLTIYPTIFLFIISVQDFDLGRPENSTFVGLANFARLFTDSVFHTALVNTLVFTSVAVTVEFGLGLGFALLVSRVISGLSVVRTILLLPMMLPPVAVAVTWKLMFHPFFGVINDVIYSTGLEDLLFNWGLITEPLGWTFAIEMALLSIIIVDIWEWTPFVFLMMLAALAGLPSAPYEAADLDGANGWQKFRDLTWPFIRPVVTIVILLRTMDAFRLFDTVVVMTRGGPGGATDTLSYYTYRMAFRNFDMGYASAMSLAMLAITIVFSLWFIRRMVGQEEG